MTRKVLFLLLFCLGIAEMTQAQSFYNMRRNRNFMVNFGSGIANYKGEMVNPGELGITKPNITAGAEYYFYPRISARASLTWFMIKGDDSKADDDRWERNLSFHSSNWELTTVGVVSLMPQRARYYERSNFNLHGFVGIGLLYFNPKTELDGEKYALQKYQTEGEKYSKFQAVIPMGVGARIRVNPFFNILIEGGYRFTFTDYLDDVSKRRYPTLDELGLGNMDPAEAYKTIQFRLSDRRYEIGTAPVENAAPHISDEEARTTKGVRGNPGENDGYFILNISVQYYLPKEIFRNSQRKLYTVKRKAYYRKPSKRR
jgi:hypothetical protein